MIALSNVNTNHILLQSQFKYYLYANGLIVTEAVFKNGVSTITSTKPYDYYKINSVYNSVRLTVSG